MRPNKTTEKIKYVVADVISSASAWTVFFAFRKWVIESNKFGIDVNLNFDIQFFKGILIVPAFWVLISYLIGYYNRPFKKSRLREVGITLLEATIASLVLFFAVILDDEIKDYSNYYQSLGFLFTVLFLFTLALRLILTTFTAIKIQSGKLGFSTLVIGGNETAVQLYKELKDTNRKSGYKFVGYLAMDAKSHHPLDKYINKIGHIDILEEVIDDHKIEEVIIAIEDNDRDTLKPLIESLEMKPVDIKIIPDMLDIMSGHVKMSAIYGAPLMEVNREVMPYWQQAVKRMFDVVFSFFAIVLLSPFLMVIAALVKFSSKGPILYQQERIGKHGKPFYILKFRSMYTDAEYSGPQLAQEDDPRITPLGKVMRKWRIDELPQFINVLKGEMSLVGPRPERQYFIDKITEVAPNYKHLHKVRPGVTSWGQVKYGYASDVDQMVRRLKYDMLYLGNMSLFVDLKILIYTALTLIKGKGQ